MLSHHRKNRAPDPFSAGGERSDARVHRLERLIERFPPRLRQAVCWLRKPSSRWARIPAGVLLSIGGLLWILPLLGLWMLPLGLLLLADDVPALHRLRERILETLERRYPHWFALPPEPRRIAAATSRRDAG
jgi:hypothetical protein